MAVLLFLRIYKTLVGLVGILGNSLVIVVICKVSFMHTLTNGFICHQAVIDLLGSLFLLLQSNIPVPVPIPETLSGEILCRVWIGDALLWLLFVTSTFSLLALTIERYIAIVYPFRFNVIFSQNSAIVIGVGVWLIGIALKSYSFMIYTVIDGICKFKPIPGSNIIGPLLIILQYFVPSIIMLLSYTHITVTLKKSAEQVAPLSLDRRGAPSAPGERIVNEQQESLLRARRNTFKTLVIVFAIFLVCWTPSQTTFFLFNMGWIKIDFDGPLMVFNTVLVASNCCINPIIYSFKYKQFRKAMNKMIGRRIARDDGLNPSAITVTAESATRQTHVS
ncbi:alpha-1A adrenergic receptor-like [Asterias amurensis]|uniref:alpha-1A adrenergic receptor-like n=1 Tax=Asterias amurensis TaxID=7602 RepID=UPI003AB2B51C